MPSGYAFAPQVRSVASPPISPFGVADLSRDASEPGSVSEAGSPTTGNPATGTGAAQGPMGRGALAADLNSNTGIAGKTLSLMGQLSGPYGGLAVTGLKAAMTAHNFSTLASLVDENAFIADVLAASPTFAPQAQDFTNIDAQALAQALGVSFGGATSFSSTGVGFGGPGQSPSLRGGQNLSNQSLAALAQSLFSGRTDAPAPTAPPDAPDTSGVASGPAGGGPAGVGSSGVSASEGQYAKGGYVDRPGRVHGGEYVIRAAVVPRHRKLLEHINAKAR